MLSGFELYSRWVPLILDLLSCFTIFPIYRRFVYYQTDSRLNLNYQSYY